MPALSLTIVPGNIQKIVREIERRERARRQRVKNVLNKWALIIESEAKSRAPVNKIIGLGGQLRSQIRRELATIGELEAFVVAGADYSAFQEFGTGRRGSASGVDTPEGYNYGSVAGVAAQPFLVPAIEMHRQQFLIELRAALVI